MNAGKRFAKLTMIAAALLLTAFFLFACAFSNGKKAVTPSLIKRESASAPSPESKTGTESDVLATPSDEDASRQGQDVSNAGEIGGEDNGETPDVSGENENNGTGPFSPQQTLGGDTTNGQDQGTQGSGEGGGGKPQAPTCRYCEVILTESAQHSSSCPICAVLPESSDAYGFLSALPGTKEELAITTLDEENESYAFVLNYLSERGVNDMKGALLSGGEVKWNKQNADGSTTIRVQMRLGAKMFTFSVEITGQTTPYKAKINLTGYAV